MAGMMVIRSRGRQSKCIADADASLQSCSRARAALQRDQPRRSWGTRRRVLEHSQRVCSLVAAQDEV